jgi:predicted Zn-dependent protease with MMP-like domain
VVLVEDDPPEDDPDLLGLYDGVALTERWGVPVMELPDRIFVFRRPLLDLCDSREELVEEVRITVVHEVAHHFGIDDDRLHELGYD